MQADRYSQVVSGLKVALPLMALALLSTLFLISRAVDPTTTIPFADTEVQERLNNQQITGPFFSGMSSRGDQISFIAETVTTQQGQTGTSTAENVTVDVDLSSGSNVIVHADNALIDIAKDRSEMIGNVEIDTSNGYRLRSDVLEMRMTALDVTAPDGITADTPIGALHAGNMRLFASDNGEDIHLVFTNGVKLLYQLQK
ncbi:MAG: hypothetical protein AB8B47_08480 [Roseobacter sp.]